MLENMLLLSSLPSTRYTSPPDAVVSTGFLTENIVIFSKGSRRIGHTNTNSISMLSRQLKVIKENCFFNNSEEQRSEINVLYSKN